MVLKTGAPHHGGCMRLVPVADGGGGGRRPNRKSLKSRTLGLSVEKVAQQAKKAHDHASKAIRFRKPSLSSHLIPDCQLGEEGGERRCHDDDEQVQLQSRRYRKTVNWVYALESNSRSKGERFIVSILALLLLRIGILGGCRGSTVPGCPGAPPSAEKRRRRSDIGCVRRRVVCRTRTNRLCCLVFCQRSWCR